MKAAGLGISKKTNTQRQALEDQDLGSRVGRERHGSKKPCNDFITGEPGLLPRNVPAADQLLAAEKGEEPHCPCVWGLGELLCQLQCAVQSSSEHGAMSVDIFLSLQLGDALGVGRGQGRWRTVQQAHSRVCGLRFQQCQREHLLMFLEKGQIKTLKSISYVTLEEGVGVT